MKFLILNTDYPQFVEDLYSRNAGLEQTSYEEQLRARMDTLFGMADFYSSNLRALGHEAYDVTAANERLQRAWLREHGHREPPRTRASFRMRRGIIPWWDRVPDAGWFRTALLEQVRFHRPDVILNQAMDVIFCDVLAEAKQHARLIVGQHAAPLPEGQGFRCYDLVLSSLPNLVEHFEVVGVPARLQRLAFEPRVLDVIPQQERDIPVSFVGSLSYYHKTRIDLLEKLCREVDIQIWGSGIERLDPDSPIRQKYRGEAWGADMYRILGRSRITVNHHIGVAGRYANNLRLYEATGMGAMLLTDARDNLREIFEPGREVVTYSSQEECVERVHYYLEHDEERVRLAEGGHQRTLRDHTHAQRAQELVEIVGERLQEV